MRHEQYKNCDIVVIREFQAVSDGNDLLNKLSDDGKPVVSVEITFPDGSEIKRRLPVDSENSGMMFAYRIVDEFAHRKGPPA